MNRNPSSLRIPNHLEPNDFGPNRKLNYEYEREVDILAPNPPEPSVDIQGYQTGAMSSTAASLAEQDDVINAAYNSWKKEKKKEEDESWINWDAALATLELADREDLTSSTVRMLKNRFQNARTEVLSLPTITGEDFNERFPPDPDFNEAPIDTKKKLNEVQVDMILQAREDNRRLIERISRGKDTYAQSTVDFIAGMLGGATVADVALTLLAPSVEAKLIATRGTPALLKTGLKSIQAARKSGGLKASIAINTAENLAMEAVSIPMENLDRRETGLIELSAADRNESSFYCFILCRIDYVCTHNTTQRLVEKSI